MRYHARWVLPITQPPIENGTVVETDGKISYVGPRSSAPAGEGGARVRQSQGRVGDAGAATNRSGHARRLPSRAVHCVGSALRGDSPISPKSQAASGDAHR